MSLYTEKNENIPSSINDLRNKCRPTVALSFISRRFKRQKRNVKIRTLGIDMNSAFASAEATETDRFSLMLVRVCACVRALNGCERDSASPNGISTGRHESTICITPSSSPQKYASVFLRWTGRLWFKIVKNCTRIGLPERFRNVSGRDAGTIVHRFRTFANPVGPPCVCKCKTRTRPV